MLVCIWYFVMTNLKHYAFVGRGLAPAVQQSACFGGSKPPPYNIRAKCICPQCIKGSDIMPLMFGQKKQIPAQDNPKGGYHPKKPNPWASFWGTLLAFTLAIAALMGTANYISSRLRYLDADTQRRLHEIEQNMIRD